MKILNFISDSLNFSKKKIEAKKRINEIIIFDRFEIKESSKCNAETKHPVKK